MTNRGFHTLREAGVVTVTRRLPPRFDVVAEASFPPSRKGRLAHQIRQDLWRALRGLRGFSPVVEVRETPDGVHVRAGGQLDAKVTQGLSARIGALLHDPAYFQRWMRNAHRDSATETRPDARALRHNDPVD